MDVGKAITRALEAQKVRDSIKLTQSPEARRISDWFETCVTKTKR